MSLESEEGNEPQLKYSPKEYEDARERAESLEGRLAVLERQFRDVSYKLGPEATDEEAKELKQEWDQLNSEIHKLRKQLFELPGYKERYNREREKASKVMQRRIEKSER